MARRPNLLLPALAVNVIIASGTFLVAKRTVAEFPPLALALCRFVLATALLWPLVRALRPDKRIERPDRGRVLLMGVLAVPIGQGLFLYGMTWASATHAALIYALTPAMVVSFVAMGSRSWPEPRQLLGIALAFAGVLLLMLQRGVHFDSHSLVGDVVIFVAMIGWSVYLVVRRKVTRRYGPLVATAEALLMGTLVYLPIGLLALRSFDPSRVTLAGWSGLFYLAWLVSALNYVIWFWGLQYLKPGTVAVLTNLQPIVTAAMAWFILHEPLPPGFAVSTLLVLGGVWLARSPIVVPAAEESAGASR